jgi:RNA polymerase sigma-70 factor (ECF subfamily)
MADDPKALTDAELIAAVVAGAQAPFQVLMERHQQAVFGYLYRLLLQDVETARDLTQSVFLKAYQHLASVERSRPFEPWLFRIAHNEAANHLRTRARRREAPLDEEATERLSDPAGVSPEETRSAAEERRAVRDALARLKPKYREVLMLHFYEEKSYEEIAEILSLSLGTVSTLIRRGKERLRALLEPAT